MIIMTELQESEEWKGPREERIWVLDSRNKHSNTTNIPTVGDTSVCISSPFYHPSLKSCRLITSSYDANYVHKLRLAEICRDIFKKADNTIKKHGISK